MPADLRGVGLQQPLGKRERDDPELRVHVPEPVERRDVRGVRGAVQRDGRLQLVRGRVQRRDAELLADVHGGGELQRERGRGEREPAERVHVHVQQQVDGRELQPVREQLQPDGELRSVRGWVCGLRKRVPADLHGVAGLREPLDERCWELPELHVLVPRQLDGRIVLDVRVPVQRHGRRGLQRVRERLRHVPVVLPDVHERKQLQRARGEREREQQHGLQLHVPEQLGRKQLCAVPDERERVCELRGVREWVRRVPELHAAVQRV